MMTRPHMVPPCGPGPAILDVTPDSVLAALGVAARTAAEISVATGLPVPAVAAALDLLLHQRRVAWRDMDLGEGLPFRVWWAVPVGLSEAWWRALGDGAGGLAA